MRRIALVVAAVVAFPGFACESSSGGNGSGKDTAVDPPPVVLLVSPTAGAVDVPVDAALKVTFSEMVVPGSVDPGSQGAPVVTVTPEGEAAVDVVIACDQEVVTITPVHALPPGRSVEVRIEAGVRDLAGNPMTAPFSWTFSTLHWGATSMVGAPTARSGHTAIWTGTEMIVWGGNPSTLAGGRYDPATDTWKAMNVEGAPAPRSGHLAVWTGRQMIVWGGTGGLTGGRYDPATDTWTTMNATGAPPGIDGASAVAADGKMIVWGGANQEPQGAVYDPDADAWTWMSDYLARKQQTALWTGTRLIVWGGYDLTQGCSGGGCICCPDYSLKSGAAYDLASDTWADLSIVNAPTARYAHSACWSGDRMFVWGGGGGGGLLQPGPTSTGGYYTPATDAWVPMAQAGAPVTGTNLILAWTGTHLLVYSADQPAAGAYYDPKTDGWSAMPTVGAPAARTDSTSIWTGTELIVWGGTGLATGARFVP